MIKVPLSLFKDQTTLNQFMSFYRMTKKEPDAYLRVFLAMFLMMVLPVMAGLLVVVFINTAVVLVLA